MDAPRFDISKFPQVCHQTVDKAAATSPAAALVVGTATQGTSVPLKNFIPAVTDPLKIICLNFHIFQDANGKGNYQPSEEARLRQVVDWVNYTFAVPKPPSHAPMPAAPLLADTRIRFKIRRFEYYQIQDLHKLFIQPVDPNASAAVQAAQAAAANTARNTGRAARQAAAVARNPSVLKELNVYVSILPPDGSGGGYAVFPTAQMSTDTNIVFVNTYRLQSDPLWQNTDFVFSVMLGHELGHCLDLTHTWDGSANCNMSHPDFLADVFGTQAGGCPHVANWGANFNIWPPKSTNNLMGGTRDASWISCLQAAMMQRALTEKSVRRYLATGCHDCASCVAFTVRGNTHYSSGAPAKLAYEVVDLNETFGWNGTDFVAPVGGIYHFDVSFQKDAGGSNDDVYVVIRRNAADIGEAWAGEGTIRGTGCVSLNVRLDPGDVVSTLANSDGGVKRQVSNYTFAGHRLCCCC